MLPKYEILKIVCEGILRHFGTRGGIFVVCNQIFGIRWKAWARDAVERQDEKGYVFLIKLTILIRLLARRKLPK